MPTLTDQYTVSQISLDEFRLAWQNTRQTLPWDCPFVTPFWLQCVVTHLLQPQAEPMIMCLAHHNRTVGFAPLVCDGDSAGFLGLADVCDYQDIIVSPEHAEGVVRRLLAHLEHQGIRRLDLGTLRPEAAISKALGQLARNGLVRLTRSNDDVTFETDLPSDWQGYLMQLTGKQRYEIRRKIRRLETHGDFTYRRWENENDLDGAIDQFLRLFQLNRQDKARFMDPTMTAYFRDLIRSLAELRMLRLYFLDVNARPAATVLCFDYNGTRYLYNSGYDADYHPLSVGILSKVFSIRKAIEDGCRRYDFLKGAEVYKKRIGGKEVPLHRCAVAW